MWYSVDEKLPNESGYYLVYRDGEEFPQTTRIEIRYFNGRGFINNDVDIPLHYSHWMYLPKPPVNKQKYSNIMFDFDGDLICEYCGNKLDNITDVCPKCGSRLVCNE